MIKGTWTDSGGAAASPSSNQDWTNAVMDYILSCLQDLVENGVEIKPDSDLVNDLGLESIKVMDLLMMLEDRFDISIPINILLDVKTPAQLMETLLPWLEIK